MQFLNLATAILLALTASVSAAPAPAASSRSLFTKKPLLPADDPFYTPPAGFENEAPGTVLRNRTIEISFFSIIPVVHAWQLLYTTTALNGSAIATVTTVFQPLGAHRDRFVSYATAYDSASTKCNPSYAYQKGSSFADNIETNAETLLIEGYLLQGYTVTSSDYEGPEAAFSAGYLEGKGLLDSLRAVSSFAPLKFTTKTPAIVGVGYSGGAIANGWAASLHDSYAPELPVKAWVLGGTPVNLTSVLLYDGNTTNSGYLPASLAGLSKPSAYGSDLESVMSDILTPHGSTAMDYANTHCETEDISEYPFSSLISFAFQKLGPGLLDHPVVSKVLDENLMGGKKELTPKVPMLIVHSKHDEIIPYAPAKAMVERYCSWGADVTFTSFGLGGHLSAGLVGFPESYAFVDDAFEGKFNKGCVYKSELNVLLNPIGLVAELEPVLSRLADLVHYEDVKHNKNSTAAQ